MEKDKVIKITMKGEPDVADGTKVTNLIHDMFLPKAEAERLHQYYDDLEQEWFRNISIRPYTNKTYEELFKEESKLKEDGQ